uniref:Uncharacterized protein n=1 Tax=Arundo donax TaxID=35708 RepID=A0A0A8YFZ2_ARUDO
MKLPAFVNVHFHLRMAELLIPMQYQ